MVKNVLVIVVLLVAVTWQGCEYEVVPAPVNCEENPVIVELVSTTDADCALMDGSVEVRASGGDGTYKYVLGNGDAQDEPLFTGIGAGVYELTAIDGNNCSAVIEVTVRNTTGMNISFTTIDAGGCNGSAGKIAIHALDGVEPYQYRINDGSYSSSREFAGLSRGLYTLTVSDATGCEVTQQVRIRSGVSFSTSIAPIIQNKCAVNDCHNGSQFPDFRVFKNVHDNASQIKALTGDGTMPQEGTLTQAEINLIACWVDDGAFDN